MTFRASRREFLAGIGTLAAGTAVLPGSVKALLAPEPLYPPVDLSYFDTPIPPAPSEIHIGYASITWNGNDRQAIEDIAALGFPGIQLRSNILKEFSGPSEVRELLEKNHLKMVALSSGGISIDPAIEAEEIAKHTANAKYVHDVGGIYLQVTDQRPKGREVTPADHKRLGHLLTEIGKRTADLGIPLGYHNHMGSLGERPEEVDRILEASDPRYAKLELDVAHYFQGGGDPVKAIQKYHDRLLFLHLKDVEPKPGGGEAQADAKRSYRFVELGRGRVNLRAVMDSLHKFNFRGWAVVELDAVPDKARTPKESAEISKKYLQERLGQTV
jgi:inosose dehydratase